MSQETVVDVHGLTKRYGPKVVVDRLSCHGERGRILGLIGPRGAGKTTVLMMLAGLVRPSEGTATITGKDCTTQAAGLKPVIGYMPQAVDTSGRLRVREYLDFFGAAYKVRRSQRGARINEVLALAGAEAWSDERVEDLAVGPRRRVALARALVHDPQVLLVDEPLAGLDVLTRQALRAALQQLAEAGKTIVVTSRAPAEMARLCHTAGLMTQGRLRAFGTWEEVAGQVRQRRYVEACFANPGHLERAAALIRAELEPGMTAQVQAGPAAVRFTTQMDPAHLAALLGRLTGQGLAVSQWCEQEVDMEDEHITSLRLEAAGQADHASAGAR